MGGELLKNFALDIEYIAGSGGIFDVAVDGRELFSKTKTGRFLEPAEIITLVKEKLTQR